MIQEKQSLKYKQHASDTMCARVAVIAINDEQGSLYEPMFINFNQGNRTHEGFKKILAENNKLDEVHLSHLHFGELHRQGLVDSFRVHSLHRSNSEWVAYLCANFGILSRSECIYTPYDPEEILPGYDNVYGFSVASEF